MQTHSMDVFYKNLWTSLVSDFRTTLKPDFSNDLESLLNSKSGLADFRKAELPTYYLSPYYYFKARYQLENLFKKVCFTNDAKTNEDRKAECFTKFIETQERLSQVRPNSTRVFLVLQEARRNAKRILKEYDPLEHASLCRFGKRATVGNTFRDSYLHEKLKSPISGSRDHIRWFRNHLLSDSLLREGIRQCSNSEPSYTECDTLVLTGVPKSWKTYRCIMPNTTLGTYYSSGLGLLIRRRLKKEGLDISRLQDKHKSWAKAFSLSRTHCTADLSSASDSITSWLLNSILPRPWFNAVKFGRIDHAKIDNKRVFLNSFMTMGIGFTFELQTLVFYCLLKAIETLSSRKGLISVYGDDLIFPSHMFTYVKQIFADINFVLNKDKTFCKESFRESCGGDYYCGIDVRPFQPEAECREVSSSSFLILLYKTMNGLLRRWSRVEIPLTISSLESQIIQLVGLIHQVPESFGDGTGVKTEYIYKWPYSPVRRGDHGNYVFECMQPIVKHRFVRTQCIYLWEKLRSMSTDAEFPPSIYEDDGDSPLLVWLRTPKAYRISNYRSTLSGKRIKQFSPYTIRKGCGADYASLHHTKSVWL